MTSVGGDRIGVVEQQDLDFDDIEDASEAVERTVRTGHGALLIGHVSSYPDVVRQLRSLRFCCSTA
jgi:hypothetical protein